MNAFCSRSRPRRALICCRGAYIAAAWLAAYMAMTIGSGDSNRLFAQDANFGGAPIMAPLSQDTDGLFPEEAGEKRPQPAAYRPLKHFGDDLLYIGKRPTGLDAPQLSGGGGPVSVEAVETSSLENLNTLILKGPLTPANGGIDYLAWRGTAPKTLAHLLEKVTGRSHSAAMRRELETLFLSSVLLPEGLPEEGPLSLRHVRLRLLGAMGAYAGLADLLEIDQVLKTGDAATIGRRSSSLLAAARMDEICQLQEDVQGLTLNRSAALSWQVVGLLCDIHHEELDRAELAYELALSRGLRDPALTYYIDYALGYTTPSQAVSRSADLEDMADFKDLQSAAAILSGAVVPFHLRPNEVNWVYGQALYQELLYASWSDAGDNRLARAAEQAMEQGLLSAQDVHALYTAPVRGNRSAMPGRQLNPEQAAADRIALYRKAVQPLEANQKQSAKIERFDLLLRGLNAAPTPMSAYLFASQFDPNDPIIHTPSITHRTEKDQAQLIAAVLHAALAHLDHDRIAQWTALADRLKISQPLHHLLPALQIARALKTNAPFAFSQKQQEDWQGATSQNSEAISGILEALSEAEFSKFASDSTSTWPIGDPHRHAELVLKASLIFEDTHPADADPNAVAEVVRSFMSLGRTQTAYKIALEAILGLI